MNKPLLALLLSAIAMPGGCDRQDVHKLESRAEQQIERAVPAIEDAAITGKVKALLIAAPEISGTDVDVSTEQHVVRLSGHTPTAAARERAESLARGVDGVKDVRNGIVVSAKAR